MRQVLRPLDQWPHPKSPGLRSRFDTSWSDTVALLEREIAHIAAPRVDEYILQIGVAESDIRLDGRLRANARPTYHGVIVSFESVHGPLRYVCDTYDTPSWTAQYRRHQPAWQVNVHAIAKTLEALRAVDRYGAVSDGQQYTGFSALPPATPMGASTLTIDSAARLLVEHGEWGGTPGDPDFLIEDPDIAAQYFRSAAKRHHPDAGGDPDLFRQLVAARDLLTGATS